MNFEHKKNLKKEDQFHWVVIFYIQSKGQNNNWDGVSD